MVSPTHSGDSPPVEDGTSPRQWITHFRKLFPVSALPSAAEPDRMLTICAGADALVKAMVEFCGDVRDVVHHIASVEKDRGAQEFIQLNFNPEHFLRNSSALLQRKL